MIQIKPEVRPIETVTPIKPSEAIRLGCLVAPEQAFGHPGDGRFACALKALDLGAPAAYHGLGWLRGCPACGSAVAGPFALVHLNDDHRWSREKIADWLESIGL